MAGAFQQDLYWNAWMSLTTSLAVVPTSGPTIRPIGTRRLSTSERDGPRTRTISTLVGARPPRRTSGGTSQLPTSANTTADITLRSRPKPTCGNESTPCSPSDAAPPPRARHVARRTFASWRSTTVMATAAMSDVPEGLVAGSQVRLHAGSVRPLTSTSGAPTAISGSSMSRSVAVCHATGLPSWLKR